MSDLTKTEIFKPEKWLVEAAAEIGLDYSILSHEITNELVNHSLKRHGDPKIHGAATVAYADFERIPDIVKNPDYVVIGAIRKNALINVYVQLYNGVAYLYFDEVLKSRNNKALRGKTLYKITRPISIDDVLHNITMNGKTDISKANVLNRKKMSNQPEAIPAVRRKP